MHLDIDIVGTAGGSLSIMAGAPTIHSIVSENGLPFLPLKQEGDYSIYQVSYTDSNAEGIKKLMKFLDRVSPRFKEIFRFCVAGGVGFVIDYGVMVALTELCGWNVLASNTISFSLSVIVNYTMCILWVFDNSNKRSAVTVLIFVGSSIVGLFLNDLFMWIMVDLMGIFYMVAKIVATILVMIWNYLTKRRAAYFNPKKSEEK